ncbi:hypothetical protein [Marinobacter sp.]|jgi:hypothetical protein|uniref:hypothetical protein n=1 Tax=Marinobacter sp. TaxID=50741 RepID=UPI000C8E664D|nr:hypothetical protein [Marinobacter sp.]MAB50251.1 hypothetical protein [Marinobacter sp.]|tara:strand:+ start:4195 stop:4830 length:636 start_codon:yes stop_codon:yes gene_type:complete
MTYRLVEIDDKSRHQHYYLEPTDHCLYLGEYTARGGWGYSEVNQLIFNLKKGVDRKELSDYQFKEQAIESVANLIGKAINVGAVSFIPVPPSKMITDPLYDDRLVRILQLVKNHNQECHWSDVISQAISTEANHLTPNRKRPEEIAALYQVAEVDPDQFRDIILVFDDIITTGAHFKAMQRKLHAVFPNKTIAGFFIARRVFKEEEKDNSV